MATQTYVDGVTLTSAAEFNRFDSVSYSVLTGVAGTNTITGTGPANYTYSSTKPPIYFTPAVTNTGATTINITPSGSAALGAKNIFAGNAALVGGELRAGVPVSAIYDGTQFQLLGPTFRQQSRTVLTSGTGATYTTPTAATRLLVRAVGPGGGGGGASANNGANGSAATVFGTLSAGAGSGGGANGGAGGAGGTSSNGDLNFAGQNGNAGVSNVTADNFSGGAGGSSIFGGAGVGVSNAAGTNAATNSGSGGGGGGNNVGNSGGGGGAGGYVEKLIVGPATTYTYTIGTGGNGGTAGTNAGGNGAAGIIVVDEFYN